MSLPPLVIGKSRINRLEKAHTTHKQMPSLPSLAPRHYESLHNPLDTGENEQSTTMISKNPYPHDKSSTVTSYKIDKTSTLIERKREQLLKSNTDMLTIDSQY